MQVLKAAPTEQWCGRELTEAYDHGQVWALSSWPVVLDASVIVELMLRRAKAGGY